MTTTKTLVQLIKSGCLTIKNIYTLFEGQATPGVNW
jgi:hypothetical protein